jgi:hypothetical protein
MLTYLHEQGEDLAKPRPFFSKESSFRNATRIHGGKDNASIGVVTTVKLGHRHHVADLMKRDHEVSHWMNANSQRFPRRVARGGGTPLIA